MKRNIVRVGSASIYRTSWGWHAYIPRTHGNGRMRRGFAKLDDAKAWIRTNAPLAALENTKPLTASETLQYREAAALLPPGCTLLEAARDYAARHAASAASSNIPTPEAVTRFLDRKKDAGCRPATIHFYRGALDRLPSVPLAEITPSSLSASLKDLHARRRNNVLATFSTFFRWCQAENLLPANPAANLEPQKTDWKPPRIYTPLQVRALFAETVQRRPDFIPYLALAAFAGVRTSGIFRLTPAAINIPDRTLTIPGAADKLRRGYIAPMSETLAAWLQAYPFPSRPITAGAYWCGMVHVFNHLQFNRIPNALRHSFASYHYALHNDAHATAAALGHLGEVETLIRHYRRLVTRADASLYFAILPRPESSNAALSNLKKLD